MGNRWLKVIIAVLVAAVLWFFMFSPWTSGCFNFWFEMSCAAVVLTSLTLEFSHNRKALFQIEKPLTQIVAGIVIAFAL